MKFGPIIDRVLTRLRDPAGIAVPRSTVTRFVSEIQKFLQLKHDAVEGEVQLTFEARRSIYSVMELFGASAPSECVRVMSVWVEDRQLDKVTYDQLVKADPKWVRVVGPEPRVWCPIGHGLFIIYPSPRTPLSTSIRFTYAPGEVTSEEDDVTTPRSLDPALIDYSSALGLMMLRQFDDVLVMLKKEGDNE